MITRRSFVVLLLISSLKLVAPKNSPNSDSLNAEPAKDSIDVIEGTTISKIGNDEIPTIEFLNNALLQKEPPCSNKNINNNQENNSDNTENKNKIHGETENHSIIDQHIGNQDSPIPPVLLHRTILPSGRTLYYLFPPWTGSTSTTMVPTTTRTTTTPAPAPATYSLPRPVALPEASPITSPLSMPLFRHQMKFVVPVQVTKLEEPPKMVAVPGDSVSKMGLDPYAYFPAYLRPRYVQMTLPYSPTYHMIRTLQIPSDHSAQFVMNNVGYQ